MQNHHRHDAKQRPKKEEDDANKEEAGGDKDGAHDANGLTVGIIPQDDASLANEFCDVVIPTGMGLTRDYLNALSADGVIIVGGGSGTLSEACASYMHKKPMVAIKNLGSSVDPYIDEYIDHRKNIKIIGVDTAQEAVQKILELITALK